MIPTMDFRGKRNDTNSWHYWNAINGVGLKYNSVIFETIGQSTSILDKNGKPIFEGDIVYAIAREEYEDSTKISDVMRNANGEWQIRAGKGYNHGLPINWGGWRSLEVIGTIYDEERVE
jgi:uncharacterized phage protein (TIGR01671 family)